VPEAFGAADAGAKSATFRHFPFFIQENPRAADARCT
jgi:hypothetical protein